MFSIKKIIKTLSSSLSLKTGTTVQTEEEEGLCILAKECENVADEILAHLEKIKPKDPNSKVQSLLSISKDMFSEKKKKDLERRLEKCRSQLDFQLGVLTRLPLILLRAS